MLGAMVVSGGLARLLSLAMVGVPGRGHLFGLAMELGVVPLLMWWQWRVERRFSPPARREGLGEGLSGPSGQALP
ncbi:MAG: hypothetical protein JWN21_2589, partial [Sphingomonas bacterium]|uniref:DUF4345 family protein n=1 Tax=Sphingomonas bacterium TaxID=1895847 RepID=UPI0026148D09